MELKIIKDMSIFKTITTGSFSIFAICVGAGSYIYITKGLGGDSFIGICSFSITSILSYILYQVAIWLNQVLMLSESSSQSNQSIASEVKIVSLNETAPPIIEVCDVIQSKFEEQKEPIVVEENEAPDEFNSLAPEKEGIKAELLEDLKVYTSLIFEPYVRETDIPILLQILEDFAEGKMNGTTFNRPLSALNGLTVKDFMHYGWNIWARLKPMNRRNTARFLKNAFPTIMKDTKESSIYAKMTCDEGAFSIKIVKLHDSLI